MRILAGLTALTALLLPATAGSAEGGAAQQRGVLEGISGEALLVRTDSGPVRGALRDGARFFGGIPYAAPPVGERRWRAPAPVAAWTAPLDAGDFAANCPQPRMGGDRDRAPQSEDCLYLNVATPETATAGARLPVLVVIHGGAYFVGSGREPFGAGAPPIVGEGVVLVAPNYRLGRLGFFAHPALSSEAPEATANYWLMDQVAALSWVRRNIASFGGDPDNVTILGCSAGGSSINALMAAPAARGLFARASAHSGGGLFNANRPLAQAEEQGMAFAGRVGVRGTGAPALAALRGLAVADILKGDSGAPDFGAVVDGHWLPAPLAVSFARGAVASVPLLTGSTSNEASVFGLMGFDRATLEQRFHLDFAALGDAYGRLDAAELLRQVQTDFIFTAPSMAMTGLAARAGLPAWSYYFDYVNSARRRQVPGAGHCEDMRYWFGTPAGASAEDREVAETMQAYLLNYLRHGDPAGPGLPPWPKVAAGTAAPLVIDGRFHVAPGFRARQLQPYYDKWQAETGLSLGFGAAGGRP